MTENPSDDNSQLLALLPLISKTVVSAADLKEFGYTKSQLMIFAALYRSGNLTMSQVSKYISSSKEQATRAVAPLVDDGLLERYVDPQNRTRVHIRLTALGLKQIEVYKTHIFEKLKIHMRKSLTQEEMLELRQSVESMIRILSKLE